MGWTLRSTPLLQSAGMVELYVPSAALTLSTVVLGFFSVMVAREIKESHRKWPYLASALLLTLLALARLYLGLDWLSGVLVGVLLGFTWSAVVGIAYRLRAEQRFSGAVVSVIFVATLATTLAWQVSVHLARDVEQLKPALPASIRQAPEWWDGGWSSLPRERTHFSSVLAREFNAQLALPLAEIRQAMLDSGWEVASPPSWQWLMKAVNPAPGVEDLPLLGKDYIGHAEVLIMRRPLAADDEQMSFRVWDSGVRLVPGERTLYFAQLSRESVRQRLAFFSYWRAEPADPDLLPGLLAGFESRQVADGLWLFRFPAPTEIAAESPAAAEAGPVARRVPAAPGVPGS
jgi:hypothetical protein